MPHGCLPIAHPDDSVKREEGTAENAENAEKELQRPGEALHSETVGPEVDRESDLDPRRRQVVENLCLMLRLEAFHGFEFQKARAQALFPCREWAG